MDVQDLGYALTQVVHNLGAVSVTGGAAAAYFLPFADPDAARRRLVWIVLCGWVAQIASGVAFGTISYLGYGRLPDIHGIAIAALVLKVFCAAGGSALAAVYLMLWTTWPGPRRRAACCALFAFAVTALCAAAFLRWFS
jgi:hypothetical protein